MSTKILFDGGMGTELYERGFFINRPFEELNLTSAADVVQVHKDYIRAGADVITTNTFSATSPQLKNFDLELKLESIIEAALENANEARADRPDVKIAFSIGPLGVLVEPLGSFGLLNAEEEFRRSANFAFQARQKKSTCVFDFFILETFTNLSELEAAIQGITSLKTGIPIIASVSLKSVQGDLIEGFARRIAPLAEVEMLGLNCSEGPSDLYSTLKKLLPLVKKPVIVQPNAGVPRHVNGRYFYMTSPDYMAKYAKRFFELGAAGVGGCCGTGPAHIEAIRSTVRMASAQASGSISVESDKREGVTPSSTTELMSRIPIEGRPGSRVGECLNSGKKILSIEVIPPKGVAIEKFLKGIESIADAGIDFVNIPDGARAMTRISSLHLAAYIQKVSKIRAIPHFTTRDRNLIGLQSDLLGAFLNGVNDILLVTGDPPKLGTNREATAVYDIDSIGLTYLVKSLNQGVSPNGETLGSRTHFGIGVASNPTAINLPLEQKRWVYKVESGADYSITQPIFDAESFLRWRDLLKETYRPHFVGIWPLVSLRNAEFMANEVPGVKVPEWVISEMEKAGTNAEEALKRGKEIAMKTIESLKDACEGFCVSAPLGKIEVAIEVMNSVGLTGSTESSGCIHHAH
jgi:methionine synthase / methylenetetrahydrofolate reductase(NADPH)